MDTRKRMYSINCLIFLYLITSCDDDTGYGWLAAYHIYTWSLLVSEWHATDGSLSLLLDLCLGLGCTVPVAEEETAILYTLLELLVVGLGLKERLEAGDLGAWTSLRFSSSRMTSSKVTYFSDSPASAAPVATKRWAFSGTMMCSSSRLSVR